METGTMSCPAPVAAITGSVGGVTTCSVEGPGRELVDDSIGVAQGTYPDTGRDTLLGGRGGDVLDAVDEVPRNDRLLGGAGRDRCRSDAGDISSGC